MSRIGQKEGQDTVSGTDLPAVPSATRRLLSVGIAAHLAVCAAGLAIVYYVSGGLAIGFSLILCIPFAIALRMRFRKCALRGSELVTLFILFVLAWGSCVFVASLYPAYFRFAVLTQRVHNDPAFGDVEFSVDQLGSKNPFHIRGTVASRSDRDRLESLLMRYGFDREMHDVQIDSSPRADTRQTPSKGAASSR